MAKLANAKPTRPARKCAAAKTEARSEAARLKLAAKVRSNSASRGVAARCFSSGSRPTIRRCIVLLQRAIARPPQAAENMGTTVPEFWHLLIRRRRHSYLFSRLRWPCDCVDQYQEEASMSSHV